MTRKRYQPIIERKQILDDHLCFFEKILCPKSRVFDRVFDFNPKNIKTV